MKNRILAWLNLAYRFGAHVLVRLPARALGYSADYQRFVETVGQEGYVPLAMAERARFPEFMQCIHCGLCTLACPSLRAAPAAAWDEAWTFVAGTARSLDRSTLVLASLNACTKCGECDAVCPTGVPISVMAAVLERLGEQPRGPGDTPHVVAGTSARVRK
ncbi:MAG: 4Fe-4S dicluster domain-containing protein [Longimicrobiales bacterium]